MAKRKRQPILISVFPENADEARRLFIAAGHEGMKETLEDRNGLKVVTFAWAHAEDPLLVMTAIPREMYAFRGIFLGGSKPPE